MFTRGHAHDGGITHRCLRRGQGRQRHNTSEVNVGEGTGAASGGGCICIFQKITHVAEHMRFSTAKFWLRRYATGADRNKWPASRAPRCAEANGVEAIHAEGKHIMWIEPCILREQNAGSTAVATTKAAQFQPYAAAHFAAPRQSDRWTRPHGSNAYIQLYVRPNGPKAL